MAKLDGSSTAEIDAPIDQVWALVEDVLVAPEWQGGLEDMESLERDDQGRATLVEATSDAKVKSVKSRVRFSYASAPNKLTWSQEKGDMKSVDGAWTLEDLGDGRTRATYSLELDTGRTLGLLIRGPIVDVVRKMLVEARAGELKAAIEKG